MTPHALACGLAAACLAALTSSQASAANPLDDLIEPVDGKSACFARIYDAAHLRRHPRQKTVSVTVWLSYEVEGPNMQGAAGLNVGLGLLQRGQEATLFSSGGCYFDLKANRNTSGLKLITAYPKESGHVCMQSSRPDVFWDVSAEEGGVLIMDRGKDRDTLMLYLDDSLTTVRRSKRGSLLDIKFGAEDRVFLLRRAPLTDCATVEEAVTTPEPGVQRRRPARR